MVLGNFNQNIPLMLRSSRRFTSSPIIFKATSDSSTIPGNLPKPPVFETFAAKRAYNKQILAGAFRLFSKYGFDEGVAGHITFRDPEYPETFWVNPFGVDFSQIKVSNLIRVDQEGNVIDGQYPVNRAAFAIHSRIHQKRSDVFAAAHSHSLYGKTWSIFGKKLDPLTQDACAFYDCHSVYNDYGGVVFELDEGQRIAQALGSTNKAVILQNHGLLTVGQSIEETVWWFISMEKCCQVQLLTESAIANNERLTMNLISHEAAIQARNIVGTPFAGWFQFMSIYERIKEEQPDFVY
jgi:ribulose-5-phosphate 4-epimerase/fuculose-1-phosphate aldolase